MGSRVIHRPIAKSPFHRFRAFTLVEMVVVIAIVILLTGLVVPAATQMWRDRKIADAQNLISGMLLTARARALQSGGAETGLFFFVDEQGVQRVVPITQNHNDPAQADPNKVIRGWESDGRWFNVFTVIRDRGFTLPAPMRVAPLYTICEEDDDDAVGICANRIDHQLFSDEELGVLSIGDLAIGDEADTAQAHRNFFTLIFSPAGELMVGRDALIRDIDDEGEAEGENEGEGVVCGLSVQGSSADSSGAVTRYYAADEDSSEVELNGQGASLHPTWLVVDSDDVAMNFPSVDGLLVYDDSLFNEAGTPQDKRTLLRSTGLPFYINRLTGAVVRGPVGEAGEMVASTP